MKLKKLLPHLVAMCLTAAAIVSCEEDFNILESSVIDQNLDLLVDSTRTVTAYSRKLLPVQTNNLPVYQLGVYNDPFYGKTVSNLLAQVRLTEPDADFGDSTQLKEVVLYMPFFSSNTSTTETPEYEVDSIYGDTPYKLNLYESNFFLRPLDPASGFEEEQKYYSSQRTMFENNLGELIVSVANFTPNTEGFVINEGEEDETTVAPGIRLNLPLEFFQQKIMAREGDDVLLNNNNFVEYFRGLYFQVEATGEGSNHIRFNLAGATLTLTYEFKETTTSGGTTTTETEEGNFILNFEGINVNTFNSALPPDLLSALQNPNTAQGEETLYIKSNTAVTFVELFGPDTDNNGVADELEDLRDKEWLVNDARLKFYVDQNKTAPGDTEPERIIIFDAVNGTILTDFSFDTTATEPDQVNALTEHLGRLERGSDAAGDFYRIRISSHISNLINRDSTNVPLGLMVSQNVLLNGFQDL
ncbi:MAG: DUF4270 domain-containing protein, partial [Marinirhabdus sp.]